ncbi:28 kda golgi snare protein [Radiomyces spectabilis]|uniref:28 kda golgi snare protein n=1 Tax=Radiomyces spectabilis TaxID=64574 RepID=UPI00222060E6|nr:28 kda golgi snare protein [Radiomyces spectabilis]KAI8384491.1 28 kda golgi snare protein [Radiomyces spectabilis]
MNRATTKASPSSPSLAPLMANDAQDEEADLSIPTSTLNWEQLRRQARQLINEIELKLAALSKIGADIHNQAPTTTREVAQQQETEELLKKFETVITSMEEYLARPSATPTNPSLLHMLERHKDILHDYTKEFRRVKANIKAARDKADLISQVQDEIRIFNANENSEADYYLSERGRVESSHRMTDMILEQAYATRQDISRQGRMIQGFNNRVGGVINRIPGINNLISRINTRRKRDTLIMAAVISTGCILILLYMLRT